MKISDNIKVRNLTSWQLVDMMIYYLDKGYLDEAKIYQDEILRQTYDTSPEMN